MYPYYTISQLAARYTALEYDPVTGRHFGKCPLCGEKTGTFTADGRKNYFFCYSCGAKGDKKEFMELMNGKKTEPPERFPKDPVMLAIYRDAAVFFYENLASGENRGRIYFTGRGLNDADFAEFGLGYAPNAFNALYTRLKKRYAEEDLMRSGLFRVSKTGKAYDFFRNRVIFPIMDENDDVIAFGGRVMDGSEPKYLNSSESMIFSKRYNLYGFPYRSQNRTDTLVICEGYMDQIAVSRTRLVDSCAILGTALTNEHVREIAGKYRKVCLALDSDGPGRRAAKISAEVLRNTGIMVTVPDFRPAKDPDEFIRRFGPEQFMDRLEKAIDADVFLMRYADSAAEIINVLMRQAV